MSRSDTVFLDRSVTFQHGIFGSECHIPTWYSWIGVSCSDTVFLDRIVTFRHDIFGSKCHVPTRYSSIGVSHSNMVFLDRSLTFRHDNIKGKTCWINGRYSISKNSTPKMVWFGGMSPHVWSWYRWLNTCLLYCYGHFLMFFVAYHKLSAIVEFIRLFFVYKLLFFVDRRYLLSTCCLVLIPTCFRLCFPFMKCSECTYDYQILGW